MPNYRHVRFAVTPSPPKTNAPWHRNRPGPRIGHTQCGRSRARPPRDTTALLLTPLHPRLLDRVTRAVGVAAGKAGMGGARCSGGGATIVPSLRTILLLGFIGHDRNGKARGRLRDYNCHDYGYYWEEEVGSFLRFFIFCSF